MDCRLVNFRFGLVKISNHKTQDASTGYMYQYFRVSELSDADVTTLYRVETLCQLADIMIIRDMAVAMTQVALVHTSCEKLTSLVPFTLLGCH